MTGSTMNLKSTVTLIGGGRMGIAMAKGWLCDLDAAGVETVNIIDPSPSDALRELCAKKGAVLNPTEIAPVDVLILAVKPQVFSKVASDAAKWVNETTLVVSVMAGITVDRLGSETGATKIVRAMPNTPGAVGAGVTAFSVSSACTPTDTQMVNALLSSLGAVEGPLDEALMDAVTVVSGCGPAYTFLLVEAMAAGGVALGLEEGIAQRLARQTVIGAGVLMDQDPTSAEDLRKAVTSPNGVTLAALEVMMAEGGINDVMKRALRTARDRSVELSKDS
ncbi:pyrroline-5-carboxylate reductase [Hirschia litorea]|uniref:Pyrroline-5-carboxylate reductase n=1 Tax=Hirschia litorea TaxID=1199156 RepID=A0ABW2IM52_9PROT